MRTSSLLPALCLALNALLPAAAVPLEMTKVVPVPVLGDFTLGSVGPTQVPNPNLPNLPAVPHRRSHHDSVNLRPREYHSADFSASPNTTAPAAPAPPASSTRKRTIFERRESKKTSHRKSSSYMSDLVSRKLQDSTADAPSSVTGPAAAAGQLANAVKSIGGVPKQVSSVTNNVPVSLPGTPVTSSDTSVADASAKQAAKSPQPVNEAEPTAGANPDAYPHVDSYDYSGSAPTPAPQKRHSLVFDSDPLLPPSDTTGKDPSMGVLNLDSNRKPEDDVPKVDTPKTPADDVPDVPTPEAAPVPTPTSP